MARKARTKGKRYSETDKKKILAAARKENLTGAQVKKRFGVTTLTFYRWRGPVRRRKAAVTNGRSATADRGATTGIGGIRDQVRQTLRELLPGVIRVEVSGYLDELFSRRLPGGPRKV